MLDLIVWLGLSALAAFRLSMLLVHEDGPYDVFDWLRYKAGITHVMGLNEVKPDAPAKGLWAELLMCPYCIAGWISAFFTVCIMLDIGHFLIIWLAMWAIVYLILKGLKQ